MNEKVVEILETAKNILESEVDWCQHKLYAYDEEGPMEKVVAACAIGAYHLAKDRVMVESSFQRIFEVGSEVIRYLCANVPPQFERSVAGYNDDPNTTKEDVLLMYKRAIEEASK